MGAGWLGFGAAAGAGTAAGLAIGAGVDMSNKSPMELLAAGGLLAEVTGDADEKSPKSAPKLSLGLCVEVVG